MDNPSTMDWVRLEGERDEARAEVERLTKQNELLTDALWEITQVSTRDGDPDPYYEAKCIATKALD